MQAGGVLSNVKYLYYYKSQKDTGWLDIKKSGTGNLQKGTGEGVYSFSRKNLASGVYIVRARADQKVIMKRILLY